MATKEELEHLRLGLVELRDALEVAAGEEEAAIPGADASWAPYHNGMANGYKAAVANIDVLLGGNVPPMVASGG